MSAGLEVDVAGEALTLLPERAAWWPRRRSLLVADVHLGKEALFGSRGLAIPGGVTDDDLARLSTLVARHGAERLVVLGDLVHAAPGADSRWPERLSSWLDDHAALDVAVVAGNHDRPGAREALDPRLAWHGEPLVDAPFVLDHEAAPRADGYALGGHLHPVVRLGGHRGDRMRLPVFWLREDHAVLPAFGAFTGGLRIEPGEGDRLYVCGPDEVLDVGFGVS